MLPKYVIDAALKTRLQLARTGQLKAMTEVLNEMAQNIRQEVNERTTKFSEEGYDLHAIADAEIAKIKNA